MSIFNSTRQFKQVRNILEEHLLDADPALLNIVLQQAEAALSRVITENSFEADVRLIVLESLENRTADANSLAKKLNLSLSTFKRKLRAENLEFRELRDDIRNKLAKELLIESKRVQSLF